MTTLYLFDLDGTLVPTFEGIDLLPGVANKLGAFQTGDRLAICTNQGGVGLRFSLELAGSSHANRYPTPEMVQERLTAVVSRMQAHLPGSGSQIAVYVAWAYKSMQGVWSQSPFGMHDEISRRFAAVTVSDEWAQSWRKPNPGMILRAIADAGGAAAFDRILYIGDMSSDREAAEAAQVAGQPVEFCNAKDFFGFE